MKHKNIFTLLLLVLFACLYNFQPCQAQISELVKQFSKSSKMHGFDAVYPLKEDFLPGDVYLISPYQTKKPRYQHPDYLNSMLNYNYSLQNKIQTYYNTRDVQNPLTYDISNSSIAAPKNKKMFYSINAPDNDSPSQKVDQDLETLLTPLVTKIDKLLENQVDEETIITKIAALLKKEISEASEEKFKLKASKIAVPSVKVSKGWMAAFKGVIPIRVFRLLVSGSWRTDSNLLVDFPNANVISIPAALFINDLYQLSENELQLDNFLNKSMPESTLRKKVLFQLLNYKNKSYSQKYYPKGNVHIISSEDEELMADLINILYEAQFLDDFLGDYSDTNARRNQKNFYNGIYPVIERFNSLESSLDKLGNYIYKLNEANTIIGDSKKGLIAETANIHTTINKIKFIQNYNKKHFEEFNTKINQINCKFKNDLENDNELAKKFFDIRLLIFKNLGKNLITQSDYQEVLTSLEKNFLIQQSASAKTESKKQTEDNLLENIFLPKKPPSIQTENNSNDLLDLDQGKYKKIKESITQLYYLVEDKKARAFFNIDSSNKPYDYSIDAEINKLNSQLENLTALASKLTTGDSNDLCKIEGTTTETIPSEYHYLFNSIKSMQLIAKELNKKDTTSIELIDKALKQLEESDSYQQKDSKSIQELIEKITPENKSLALKIKTLISILEEKAPDKKIEQMKILAKELTTNQTTIDENFPKIASIIKDSKQKKQLEEIIKVLKQLKQPAANYSLKIKLLETQAKDIETYLANNSKTIDDLLNSHSNSIFGMNTLSEKYEKTEKKNIGAFSPVKQNAMPKRDYHFDMFTSPNYSKSVLAGASRITLNTKKQTIRKSLNNLLNPVNSVKRKNSNLLKELELIEGQFSKLVAEQENLKSNIGSLLTEINNDKTLTIIENLIQDLKTKNPNDQYILGELKNIITNLNSLSSLPTFVINDLETLKDKLQNKKIGNSKIIKQLKTKKEQIFDSKKKKDLERLQTSLSPEISNNKLIMARINTLKSDILLNKVSNNEVFTSVNSLKNDIKKAIEKQKKTLLNINPLLNTILNSPIANNNIKNLYKLLTNNVYICNNYSQNISKYLVYLSSPSSKTAAGHLNYQNKSEIIQTCFDYLNNKYKGLVHLEFSGTYDELFSYLYSVNEANLLTYKLTNIPVSHLAEFACLRDDYKKQYGVCRDTFKLSKNNTMTIHINIPYEVYYATEMEVSMDRSKILTGMVHLTVAGAQAIENFLASDTDGLLEIQDNVYLVKKGYQQLSGSGQGEKFQNLHTKETEIKTTNENTEEGSSADDLTTNIDNKTTTTVTEKINQDLDPKPYQPETLLVAGVNPSGDGKRARPGVEAQGAGYYGSNVYLKVKFDKPVAFGYRGIYYPVKVERTGFKTWQVIDDAFTNHSINTRYKKNITGLDEFKSIIYPLLLL